MTNTDEIRALEQENEELKKQIRDLKYQRDVEYRCVEDLRKAIINDVILEQMVKHFTIEGNETYNIVTSDTNNRLSGSYKKELNDRIRECNRFIEAIQKARGLN